MVGRLHPRSVGRLQHRVERDETVSLGVLSEAPGCAKAVGVRRQQIWRESPDLLLPLKRTRIDMSGYADIDPCPETTYEMQAVLTGMLIWLFAIP